MKCRILLFTALGLSAAYAATPAELMDQYTGSLNQLSALLEGVKDAGAAKTSLAPVTEAARRIEMLKPALSKLNLNKDTPDGAALLQQKGPEIQQASQRLHNELVRIGANGVLRRELKPALSDLLPPLGAGSQR
jgi:hypothetical protein